MASEDRARNVVKRIQTSPVVSRGRTSTGARVYTENAKRAMRRASQQIVNFSSLRRCVAAAVQPAPFTRVALRGRLAVEADELDERHRGRVALAGARLQDARVAALSRREVRADFGEQAVERGARGDRLARHAAS